MIRGLALVVAFVVAFAMIERHSGGIELAVELHGGRNGSANIARAVETAEPDAPGLRRTRWRVTYRGDHVREVGATALDGPSQVSGACSARLVVGQALLDRLAPMVGELVANQLADASIIGIGHFVRVEHPTLRWARFETHLYDAQLLGSEGARDGYVRATATVRFEHAAAPITIALIPDRAAHFRIAVHAELELQNRVLEWLSEKLPTAEVASKLAARELDGAIATTLEPPPPVELGDGQTLRFVYCDAPIEVRDGEWAVLPFGVAFEGAPPHFAAGPRVEPRANTMLALDLDIDALDAMLFELWRSGWLDRRIAEAGLDRAFARDATVAQYLSVRVGSPTLALPPVLEPAGDHLRLAADARIAIRDGEASTVGRVFGALALTLPATVKLAPLELACERTPTTLVPCYADLVAGLAARSGDFDGVLAARFIELVRQIFGDRRLGVGDVPVALHVRGATLSLAPGARGVHVELDADLLK
ncbi:MAG TPA: hypothetical protein VGG28_18440 [Kofleriaceae bacterium]